MTENMVTPSHFDFWISNSFCHSKTVPASLWRKKRAQNAQMECNALKGAQMSSKELEEQNELPSAPQKPFEVVLTMKK